MIPGTEAGVLRTPPAHRCRVGWGWGARNPASPAPEGGTRWAGLAPGPAWIRRVEDPNLILSPGWG